MWERYVKPMSEKPQQTAKRCLCSPLPATLWKMERKHFRSAEPFNYKLEVRTLIQAVSCLGRGSVLHDPRYNGSGTCMLSCQSLSFRTALFLIGRPVLYFINYSNNVSREFGIAYTRPAEFFFENCSRTYTPFSQYFIAGIITSPLPMSDL